MRDLAASPVFEVKFRPCCVGCCTEATPGRIDDGLSSKGHA